MAAFSSKNQRNGYSRGIQEQQQRMLKVNGKRKECLASQLWLLTSLPSFFFFLPHSQSAKCSWKCIAIVLGDGETKYTKELLPMTCDNCRLVLLSAACTLPSFWLCAILSLWPRARFCSFLFPLKYNNVPMVELMNELRGGVLVMAVGWFRLMSQSWVVMVTITSCQKWPEGF